MKYLFSAVLIFIGFAVHAQVFNHDVYMVNLSDKDNTPYSVFRPEAYLSTRAIERREKQRISIDERDLPVDPNYLKQLNDLGAEVILRSKWLNAVSVHITDSVVLAKVKALPFVTGIRAIGKRRPVKEGKFYDHFPIDNNYEKSELFYGQTENQITMLGGHVLHSMGYRGAKIHVAIFDGGFLNVYRMPAFDSLFVNNRILGTHDFVEGDEFVYEASTHGTNVLSCMAANLPYLVMGTAPDAAYYLFKTEDVGSEFLIEEFNWVAAAEHADSLGVDVVNSSLGYTGFNDKSMSYEYKDLNGKTAICTRGADIAVEKGMLIVNSAGNEGDGPWHYIGAPADGVNVISVGAVMANGKRANFSSYGPTSDGRIKPNVSARGRGAVVAGFKGYTTSATDGTSFSSPILAGMVATLWGAFPNKTNWEIKDAIEAAGSQSTQPDSSLGYGIPDFFKAYMLLSDASMIITASGKAYSTQSIIYDKLDILLENQGPAKLKYTLYNKLMQPIFSKEEDLLKPELRVLELPNLGSLQTGVYVLGVELKGQRHWLEIVKG